MFGFSGKLDSGVIADIRQVYLRSSWVLRGIFLLGVGLMAWSCFPVGLPADHPAWHWDRTTSILLGTGCLLAAILVPGWWFSAWRRQFGAVEGAEARGFVSSDGFHLSGQGDLAPWSLIRAAKLSHRIVLLYLNKWHVLPIHRSMVPSEETWLAIHALVREKVRSRLVL